MLKLWEKGAETTKNRTQTDRIYIPPRLYERFGCFYSCKASLAAAPAGCGKSTMIREFIARSRADGLSCRYIREAKSAVGCFSALCRIVLGHDAFPPETDREFFYLKQELRSVRAENTIVIIDCPFSAEMFLENLRTAELFIQFCPIRLIIVADYVTPTHISAALALGMTVIGEEEFRFTPSETEEFFRYCSIECGEASRIANISDGRAIRLKLCAKLVSLGRFPQDGSVTALLESYADAALSTDELGVLICTFRFETISVEYLDMLRSSAVLSEYFGRNAFSADNVISVLKAFEKSTGLCRVNIKTRAVAFHPCIGEFIERRFSALPEKVRGAMRICTARQNMRLERQYFAFCEFFRAGDYVSAAECANSKPISLRDLIGTKDTLTDFVKNCPLTDKTLLQRYLRVLAMLMLTSEKNMLKGYFSRAIDHISKSDDYTVRERRRMLAYAYAMRTYEDFFFIERMGNHIKRAYEYYDGSGSQTSAFYTWNMYVPSLFGLIHNYSQSLSTEREQFGRFHKMYSEILNHGEFILDFYNAEAAYFTGDTETAERIASQVLKLCIGKKYDAPRLIGLLLTGKTAAYYGDYLAFENAEAAIVEILHKTAEREVYTMARLCLALLGIACGNIKYNAFFACCKDRDEIAINRFAAPYYCLITALYCLVIGKTERILGNEVYYFSVADEVRNGTVRHQMLIILAETHFLLGNDDNAAEYAKKALGFIEGTSIFMPAAEVLTRCPHTRKYYRENSPENATILRACAAAEKFMTGADTVMTYKLTRLGSAKNASSAEAPQDSARAKQLGLTKHEYDISVLAARALSNEQIAQKLSISIDSVKSCLKRVYAKTGVRSRRGLEALLGRPAAPSPEKNERQR